jgi:uncharacterized repeat protein (TIGR03803 family)
MAGGVRPCQTDLMNNQRFVIKTGSRSFPWFARRPGGPVLKAVLAMLVLAAAPVSRAQVFEVLFADNSGRNPYSGLVAGSDASFYGTTYGGGADSCGTVFRATPGGALTTLASFNRSNGASPYARPVLGDDGSLYGTTYQGGANNLGGVYKVSPDGVLTLLASFNASNGSHAYAGLARGGGGVFYGTTYYGGASGKGVVFMVTSGGVISALVSFDGANGAHPKAEPTLGADGNFYGTTEQGGVSNQGTVYRMTPAGDLTVLLSFSGANGAYPRAGLVLGADGGLYGTTDQGGANNSGTVFRMTSAGSLTTLHSFNGGNGANPRAGLTLASDGSFCGTTTTGGASNLGTVFKITSAGVLTTLSSFSAEGGHSSYAAPVEGADGSFYGTTSEGAAGSQGTVFKVTSGGVLTTLASFNSVHGSQPWSDLVQDGAGNFYGTTETGGANGLGTVFKVTPDGEFTSLVSFAGPNGANPRAALVKGDDGLFYGTTGQGGATNQGTVFRVTPGGVLTTLVSLNAGTGWHPRGRLVQAGDGSFCGTAEYGGVNGYGTVFQVTPEGILTVLASLNYESGTNPWAGVVQGDDGSFYGMTTEGGAGDMGTVFKVTPGGVLTTLVSFQFSNGAFPYASLVKGQDGSFYGTTAQGGSVGYGTVFKITPGGVLTTLVSFNQANGATLWTVLTLGPDGHFYGTTMQGGTHGKGSVFKVTPGGVLTTLHSLDGVSSGSPRGGPAFGADGALYGTAEQMVVWRISFPEPEIVVEQPAGAELVSGVSNVDFGGVAPGDDSALNLTVRNTGTAILSGLSVSRTGGSSAFALTAAPAGSLTAGGQTAFTLTFTPDSAGPASATFEVLSNDADENPFVVLVTGMGLSAGEFNLSSAVYTAFQGDVGLHVTVTRTGGSLPASVTLGTADGIAGTVPPFAPALAGADYVAQSTVMNFARDEMSRDVNLSLIPKAGATVPNKRFNIALSGPAGGAVLGPASSAQVRILAADTVRPSLTVISPAATVTALSTTSPFLVKGAAGDARGVDRVEVLLNGAPVALQATLGASTSNTSVPWSLSIAPLEGVANTLAVTAYDLRGNVSATVNRSFTYTRRYSLAIRRVAPDGIAVGTAGSVTISATPAAAASAQSPVAVNASPKLSAVLPGTPVKLTATPRPGYVFSHWNSLPPGAVALGHEAALVMPAGDADAEAVFVSNGFLATLGEGIGFYGLLQREPDFACIGFITGSLVPSTGAFSGTILMEGSSHAITGRFYGDGRILYSVAGVKSYDHWIGARRLDMFYGMHGIVATLSEDMGMNMVWGHAARAVYSSLNKVPGALLNQKMPATAPVNNRGFFTLAMPAKAQMPERDVHSYPQGEGFGSITLSEVGGVTWAGTLADGSTFTSASGLVMLDECPVFAALVTPGQPVTVKGGRLGGVLHFSAGPESDVTALNLQWMRPSVVQLPGTTVAARATQLYTAGWPDGITLDAFGSLYDKTVDVKTALGLDPVNLADGNGRLEFTGGRLVGEPVGAVSVTAFNISPGGTAGTSMVTKIPATNSSFTLNLSQGLGTFGGTFTPNWTPASTVRPSFKGILIQKGGGKGGHGYFISNRPGDLDPESGRAALGSP